MKTFSLLIITKEFDILIIYFDLYKEHVYARVYKNGYLNLLNLKSTNLYIDSIEIEKNSYFSYLGCMSGYVNEDDPSDVSMESTYKAIFEVNFSTVESESKTKVTSDSNAYHFYTSLNVIQNGKPYYNKTWLKTFPRVLT